MAATLINSSNLVIWIFALGFGLSAALIGWVVSRAAADVPEEDRQYKDPPPLGFRIIWWPVQWISYYLGPLISRSAQARMLGKLRKAGLDYCLSPAQFLASRILCGIAAGLLACWVLASFDRSEAGGTGFSSTVFFQVFLLSALLGGFYPGIWLKDRLILRRRELLKTLPFYLDIITLCVEAGLNLQGAMQQAVLKGPKGVLRDELQRVLRDIRAGKPRAESLRNMAQRVNEPGVTNFTITVIQAESMGMNLGPVLRAQAEQRRTERFLRAEKLAMEAPIKLLFPLIVFIFPCTFIVLFFPIAVKFMESGL